MSVDCYARLTHELCSNWFIIIQTRNHLHKICHEIMSIKIIIGHKHNNSTSNQMSIKPYNMDCGSFNNAVPGKTKNQTSSQEKNPLLYSWLKQEWIYTSKIFKLTSLTCTIKAFLGNKKRSFASQDCWLHPRISKMNFLGQEIILYV